MYDEILFPTDGSDYADSVLPYALQIASEHDATIHILNVADTGRDSVATIRGEVIDTLVEDGRRIVESATARANDDGVSVVPEVLQGTPHSAIVDYSDQSHIDCIVMATHGRRGLHRYLLGSVTERVINTASTPVISVNPDRNRPLNYPCQHVLVPTDGSPGATLAVREGIDIAKTIGATLHLLHVVETGNLGPDARSLLKQDDLDARGDEIVTAATEMAAAASLASVTSAIEHGVPSKVIRAYIDDNDIGLAIMGTQGTTDFNSYVMGGVSAKLARTSPVPVMWVGETDAEPTGDPES